MQADEFPSPHELKSRIKALAGTELGCFLTEPFLCSGHLLSFLVLTVDTVVYSNPCGIFPTDKDVPDNCTFPPKF